MGVGGDFSCLGGGGIGVGIISWPVSPLDNTLIGYR